jgi:predicted molibdopterin-dependent oxidoreductase YjgC
MAHAERIKDVQRPGAVRFTVGDRIVEAPLGENLACALMAVGIRRLRASPRGHADRGAFCLMGVCQECVVRVDGRVTTACTEPVRAGMIVELGERA